MTPRLHVRHAVRFWGEVNPDFFKGTLARSRRRRCSPSPAEATAAALLLFDEKFEPIGACSRDVRAGLVLAGILSTALLDRTRPRPATDFSQFRELLFMVGFASRTGRRRSPPDSPPPPFGTIPWACRRSSSRPHEAEDHCDDGPTNQAQMPYLIFAGAFNCHSQFSAEYRLWTSVPC